jgi:hypothetical protein
MAPALGGKTEILILTTFKRLNAPRNFYFNLASHIETDSRENKRKALHIDSNSDSDSDQELSSTNKRLRSASVEPLPQPLIVPPTPEVIPTTPTNPDPKAIPKSLRFTKSTMTNNSANSNRCKSPNPVNNRGPLNMD